MIENICIVKIIDQFTIVINKGSDDGITTNQEFLVYSIDEEHIIDPITNEDLGKLEIVKGRAKIKHIQNKLTTLESNSYVSPQKRVITKANNSILPFQSSSEETIVGEKEQLPFNNIVIGDSLKLI